jgi:hypothetical protein
MEHHLDDTISLLANTPSALNALLRHLPETWTEHNEGGESWTVHRVIGHLINNEQINWMPRARWILEFGDSRPFEPFERIAPQSKPLPELLDDFAAIRSQKLDELRSLNLQKEDLARRGLHQQLGPVTLSQLLATWATHDLTHLHQISRIMAHQYRNAVGPWIKFLGVLHCDGHSSTD